MATLEPEHEALDQTTIDGMFNVAVDHYTSGDLDEAIAVLQLLSFLAPEDKGVWLALAQCHDDLGQSTVANELRAVPERIAEAS